MPRLLYLKRFKRIVMNEEIIKDIKKHAFYLKPGQRKRVKSAEARKRARKNKKRSWDSDSDQHRSYGGQLSVFILTAWRAGRLCEGQFVKGAALVNPAPILGPHLIHVPRAGIGPKHYGFVGFEHAPLGLVYGLAEVRTR